MFFFFFLVTLLIQFIDPIQLIHLKSTLQKKKKRIRAAISLISISIPRSFGGNLTKMCKKLK